MSLRLIFMGTPDFAVPTLLELVAHGHEIVAVYTREAKPAKRGMKLQPSPVEQEARRLGIPVSTPKTLRTPEAIEAFSAQNADAAVVVAVVTVSVVAAKPTAGPPNEIKELRANAGIVNKRFTMSISLGSLLDEAGYNTRRMPGLPAVELAV